MPSSIAFPSTHTVQEEEEKRGREKKIGFTHTFGFEFHPIEVSVELRMVEAVREELSTADKLNCLKVLLVLLLLLLQSRKAVSMNNNNSNSKICDHKIHICL